MTHDKTKEYAWAGKGKEKKGKEQIDFLKKNGLKPHMKFLDIGCGWFRTGIPIIEYIGKENYYAIDKVDYSGMAIKALGIDTFKQTENFELFDEKFDMILAWSVFTHLESDDIEKCIKNVVEVMHDGSKFFATFFKGKKQRFGDNKEKCRCYSYPYVFFEKLAKKYKLKCKMVTIKQQNQKMILFQKSGEK